MREKRDNIKRDEKEKYYKRKLQQKWVRAKKKCRKKQEKWYRGMKKKNYERER